MGRRAAARRTAYVLLVTATTVLAACTTAMPPGFTRTAVLSTPAPVMTTIEGMTAVPEAADCVNERLDGRRSDLPGPQLFPTAFPGSVSVRLVLPGRDASDPTCRADLAKRFSCRDATSWAVPDPAELMLSFAARQVRVLEGTSTARTRSTADGLGLGPAKRSFTYAEYVLPEGDPWGAVAFERRAFDTCAPGTAVVVHGVPVQTGLVGTGTGLVDAAFIVAGDRLALVALSGSRWSMDERDRAWQVVAQHLELQE